MMRNYVAAAMAVVLCSPALAIDVGVKAGGVGASVGIGRGKGVSVGLGADLGKAGEANVSVGARRGSGIDVDVDANVAGANIGASVGASRSEGLSVGLGIGNDPSNTQSNTGGGVSIGAGGAGHSGSVGGGNGSVSGSPQKPDRGASRVVALPGSLLPSGAITLPIALAPSPRGGKWGYPKTTLIVSKPGVPHDVVRACRTAITAAAKSHGAVSVKAVSAGRLRSQGGGSIAPLSVSIDYGGEVKQSKVSCSVNASGRVTAVS